MEDAMDHDATPSATSSSTSSSSQRKRKHGMVACSRCMLPRGKKSCKNY